MAKNVFLIFLVWAVSFFNCSAKSQSDRQSQIKEALGDGNTTVLVSMMNSNVELTLPNSSDVHSKNQTKVILDDLFNKNKPSNFLITHKTENEKSGFIMGKLYTDKGSYNINILLRKSDSPKFLIYQLRIEKSNE